MVCSSQRNCWLKDDESRWAHRGVSDLGEAVGITEESQRRPWTLGGQGLGSPLHPQCWHAHACSVNGRTDSLHSRNSKFSGLWFFSSEASIISDYIWRGSTRHYHLLAERHWWLFLWLFALRGCAYWNILSVGWTHQCPEPT